MEFGYYFYNKKVNTINIDYSTAKLQMDTNRVVYQDFKSFRTFINKCDVTTFTKDYNYITALETYNEEFFKTHNLATISIYQDTSKDYINSLDDLKYNEDKTQATVYYTAKSSGYLGTLTTSWYYTYFIEIDKTAKTVNYINNASSEE